MITMTKPGGVNGSTKAEFTGKSTDAKPSGEIPNGSSFFEIDTSDIYFYDIDTKAWIKGGGA